MGLQDFIATALVTNGLLDCVVNFFPLASRVFGILQSMVDLAIGRSLKRNGAVRGQSIPILREVGLDSRCTLFQRTNKLIAPVLSHGGRNVDVPELSRAFRSCLPQRSQRLTEFGVAMAREAWRRTVVIVTIGSGIRPIDIIVGNRLTATVATTKPAFHIDFRERVWKQILVITIAPSSAPKRNALRLGESAATPVSLSVSGYGKLGQPFAEPKIADAMFNRDAS